MPDRAIDGELVMLNANGKPEFHQLVARQSSLPRTQVVCFAFQSVQGGAIPDVT